MIRIVTDSTCYLPPDYVSEYDISVVPLKVQLGAETFAETQLSNDEFYQRLAITNELPTTSQPAVGEFRDAYQSILIQNQNAEILVLTISSKLSGTYSSAVTAASQVPEAHITVFDSLSAAMGVGLMVMAAAEMVINGQNLAEIMVRLEQMRQELTIFLVVDTLEYLKRGGRIGAAAAFLGTLLHTKPILTIIEGDIKPFDRVRTKKKALNRLFVALEQRLPDPPRPIQAGVMHVAAEDEAKELGQMVKDNFNVSYFFILELGPVVGVHVGPGTLGAGFCPEPA